MQYGEPKVTFQQLVEARGELSTLTAERDQLRARISELDSARERDMQEAYEQGLTQRDGPDELTEEQRDVLALTYDKHMAGSYAEHGDDVSTLHCIITQLENRLSARSARVAELERERDAEKERSDGSP